MSDGSCIPISGICNGVIECTDRSDKLADCGKLSMNLVGLDKLVCLMVAVSQSLENVMVSLSVLTGLMNLLIVVSYHIRGSRKLCQRESKFNNVFF